jgi:hypothetical protein
MQRGAASAIIVIVLFLITSAALLSRIETTASIMNDAVTASMRLQALYLAESGLERASRRFGAGGVACGSLAESDIALSNVGTFSISAGSTLGFDGVTSAAGSCRVQVTGRTASGGVVRVIEAMLTPAVLTNATRGNRDFVCNVPAGENLLSVVSVAWSGPASPAISITSVVLGGVPGTAVATDPKNPALLAPVRAINNAVAYSAQIYYVKSPPVGSSVAGTVTLNGNPTGIVIGCITLAGVNQSAPVDTAAQNTGQGASPGVSLTTTQVNTFVIDNLVRDNGGKLEIADVTSTPTRVEMWNFTSNASSGAGSYRGPVPTSSTVQMNWNWTGTGNKAAPWAIAAVSIAGDPASGTGARVRLLGGGLSGWREVVTATLP